MIEFAHGLTDSALEAIAGLERRVVNADGGRLKLGWSTLRERPADEVRDLLWWEGERLLGFLGIYGFNWQHLEVTGMVDPDARRRGIGRALFEAALPLCREERKDRLLLVIPRNSPGGAPFAGSFAMTYEHSEHALRLSARPAGASRTLGMRQARESDIPVLSWLYDDAFHDGGHVDPARLASQSSWTLMIEREGSPVGTLRLERDGDGAAIYGFVVDPGLRGQGIGREALRRVCQEEFDGGARHVELEVEVANDHALGLYTSVGFQPVATEDYYELMLS